ncbi:hypothetical protein D3C79_1020410 [compost metagenome]
MAILAPHHHHVRIQRAAIFGAEEQKRIASTEYFDPTIPDLSRLSRILLDAVRFAGHHREAAVRKHAVNLFPCLGLLRTPLQVNDLP